MSWFEYVAKKKKGEYNVRRQPFVLPVAGDLKAPEDKNLSSAQAVK